MNKYEDWCSRQKSQQPMFVIDFELALLTFVRSIRCSNFQLYIDSLTNLVAWFFVKDRTHYARLVPVHIRDMIELEQRRPDVFCEFNSGKFTVKKSDRSFSATATDHAHEQLNAAVKGDGGAIGLTENENALRRWLIAGPEIARLILFDMSSTEGSGSIADTSTHHKLTPSV
jgi:hypothetical protein